MPRAKIKSNLSISKFNIRRFNFAIPLMAITGLATLGIFAIDQDVDPSASASNVSPISSTISYEDEYITISNSASINIGTADVVADGDTYIYTTDNVTVSTNVSTGYDLYITSGNSETAALTTPEYYTEIAATSGTGSDTGTPKVLDANSYGYAVPNTLATNSKFDSSYANPTTTSKWAGVPVGKSDRLRSTNEANEQGDTIDVHYGAYVTNYLAEGTYTGSVVYSAVVTPTHETVNMTVSPSEGAKGTTLTITSGPTNISTTHELATSEVEVYFRQNNITKGTCNVTRVDPSAGHLITTCTVPVLSPGTYDVAIIVPRYGFNDIKLNGFVNTGTISEFTYMQDLTAKACSNTAIGTTYNLKDSRDNNSYSIRKLPDGNCWMVNNLRLIGPRTLTSSDSDISSDFTLPTAPSTSFDNNNYDVINYRNSGYYNWYTATASSGTQSKSSGNVSSSICPKGWKLPLGTSTSSSRSWYYLGQQYGFSGSTTNSTYRSNFQSATNTGSGYWGGYYSGNSISSSGEAGKWWSRTAADTSKVYILIVSSSSVDTVRNYDNVKYWGFNVRCVFVGS